MSMLPEVNLSVGAHVIRYVEVTPEMVHAGLEAMRANGSISMDDALPAIYRAMEAMRQIHDAERETCDPPPDPPDGA